MRRIPRLEVFQDRRGSWRWRVRATNGRLVCTSGEAFASQRNAKRAARTVRRNLFACSLVTCR